MWKLDSQVALRKTPLPAAFQHGQSLEAKCWSERFTAGTLKDVSMTMSCVAGTWINSGNAPGLEGFTCTACLQVVSKAYADLDAKIRGTSDVFVAELMPDAADTMRRYRSLSEPGKCLRALDVQLNASDCAVEAEPDQMIEAVELGSLLWDEFQAGAGAQSVPGASGSGLYSRGTGPTTLRSFKLDADCGQHVMASVKLSHNSQLGMSATCTAASTYGDPIQHTIPVPGAVTITSVSINRIIPWKLKEQSTNGCVDDFASGQKNVYVHPCHNENNQLWYMLDGNIFTLYDHKCLDYAMDGSDNVYMHECHDGANQKWYFDEDNDAIRSVYDHRCLDMNEGPSSQNANIYMHDCHFKPNQQFVREEVSSKAFTMALHLDCTDSEFQQITVEPVGSESKFQLRHDPHTLPSNWTYDSDKKIIKRSGGKKCLEARGRGRVEEVDCAERIEQEWTISHGLPGLVDAPLLCPGDQDARLTYDGLWRYLQPFTGIGVVERTNARRNLQPFTGIGVVERTNARLCVAMASAARKLRAPTKKSLLKIPLEDLSIAHDSGWRSIDENSVATLVGNITSGQWGQSIFGGVTVLGPTDLSSVDSRRLTDNGMQSVAAFLQDPAWVKAEELAESQLSRIYIHYHRCRTEFTRQLENVLQPREEVLLVLDARTSKPKILTDAMVYLIETMFKICGKDFVKIIVPTGSRLELLHILKARSRKLSFSYCLGCKAKLKDHGLLTYVVQCFMDSSRGQSANLPPTYIVRGQGKVFGAESIPAGVAINRSILHALLCALPAAKAAAAVDPESESNHDDMEECQEDELEVTEAPAEAEDADALAGAKDIYCVARPVLWYERMLKEIGHSEFCRKVVVLSRRFLNVLPKP
eukprot:s4801_g2.t2